MTLRALYKKHHWQLAGPAFHQLHPGAKQAMPARDAVAMLSPPASSAARGKVAFRALEGGGLQVTADLEGLPPGKHAFHVHLYGDCGGNAEQTGTHLNFSGSSEHPPANIARITGNLGDLDANKQGVAHFEGQVADASLQGKYSIVGRSVVVHEKPNDPKSPPMGAAGGRSACGVIGLAKNAPEAHAPTSARGPGHSLVTGGAFALPLPAATPARRASASAASRRSARFPSTAPPSSRRSCRPTSEAGW